MQRSTVLTAFQRAAAVSLAAVFFAVIVLAPITVPAALAQDASSAPSAPSAVPAQKAVSSSSQPFDMKQYSKPLSPFPNPIAPYTARHVAPPNLANTPRIDQLMRDGKLYISMNDAVALALENNLDIAIARYNLNIADTDVWRAKSGSNTLLGVNNGVVQNTPGGGIRRSRHPSRLRPGRNLSGRRRRRSRFSRLGRIHLRQRPQHHQLRSHSYGHVAGRPQQYPLIQYFQSSFAV